MRVESLKKVVVKSIYFKIVTLLSESEKASKKTLQLEGQEGLPP